MGGHSVVDGDDRLRPLFVGNDLAAPLHTIGCGRVSTDAHRRCDFGRNRHFYGHDLGDAHIVCSENTPQRVAPEMARYLAIFSSRKEKWLSEMGVVYTKCCSEMGGVVVFGPN